MRLVLCVVLVCATGCARGGGKIRSGDSTVMGVPDAGTPATLNTAKDDEVIPIPAGSEVIVVETEAVEAQPATADTPAVEAKPASKETTIRFAGSTHWKRSRATVKADTGTIDTSVAKHRIDVDGRKPLLYISVGLLAVGVILRVALKEWPTPGNGAMIAGLVAGLAWKMSEIPWWAFLLVLGGGALLVLGYKRAEWDRDGDGVPDILQRKNPPNQP